MPGCATRNAPTRGATGSAARVGSATRSRRPAVSPDTASTAARPVSTSRSTWRAGSTRASPAEVSTTRRPTRWKSGVPSSVSSSRIACDTEGCDTYSASAARVIPPPSTTARNRRSLRRSIGTAYGVHKNYVLDFWTRQSGRWVRAPAPCGSRRGHRHRVASAAVRRGRIGHRDPGARVGGVPARSRSRRRSRRCSRGCLLGARQYWRAGVLDWRVVRWSVASACRQRRRRTASRVDRRESCARRRARARRLGVRMPGSVLSPADAHEHPRVDRTSLVGWWRLRSRGLVVRTARHRRRHRARAAVHRRVRASPPRVPRGRRWSSRRRSPCRHWRRTGCSATSTGASRQCSGSAWSRRRIGGRPSSGGSCPTASCAPASARSAGFALVLRRDVSSADRASPRAPRRAAPDGR